MSDVSIISGGPSLPPPFVNGDGATITVESPVGSEVSTDLGTDLTILLENQLATGAYPIGTPVYPNANGTHFTIAEANAAATSAVVGLLTAPTTVGGKVRYRDRGLMKLTVAQWDVLVGGSSGLTPGAFYYLSAATPGLLTTTIPSGANSGVLVGKAITPTLMMISINLVSLGSS
jgi:hypothetical protein